MVIIFMYEKQVIQAAFSEELKIPTKGDIYFIKHSTGDFFYKVKKVIYWYRVKEAFVVCAILRKTKTDPSVKKIRNMKWKTIKNFIYKG